MENSERGTVAFDREALGAVGADVKVASAQAAMGTEGSEVAFCSSSRFEYMGIKIKPGDHRFWSMLPLARLPFGVPILDPQLYIYIYTHVVSL